MNDNPSRDDLSFANRRRELHELVRSDDSWYIYAPAGMGKTRLLEKMNEELLGSSPSGNAAAWFTAWVRFDLDNAARTSRVAVLQSLINSGRPIDNPQESEDLPGQQIHEAQEDYLLEQFLNIAIQNHSTRLALFLDALENANESIIDYLETELIPDLKGRGTITCLRVFVSARWRGSTKPGRTGLTPIEMWLTPFRHKDLCEVLGTHYKNPSLSEGKDIPVAWHLLELCRGHPKSVSKILQRVGKNPRLDEQGRLFNHERLFNEIVKSTIKDEIVNPAMTDADIGIRPLESIFTLRVINPSLLRECLQTDEVLADFKLHEKGKHNELYRKVQGTRLVDLSTNQANMLLGHTMDPVVRHFISMSLMYQEKPRHRELHERAFNYYKRQLEDINENAWFAGPVQLLTATEALYHYCCMLLTPEPENGNHLASVKQCIDNWRDKWRCGNIDKDRFAEEWLTRIKVDPDLPLMLRMLLGEQGAEALRKHIETTVTCVEQPEVNEEAE